MSSNRLITRALLALCLAGSLTACATDGVDKKDPPPLTPTEKFAIKVSPHDDQIMLAPHAGGLSPAQMAALSDLADRWRDQGEAMIHIQSPKRGGEEAYRSVAAIQDALYAVGVTADKVDVVDYDPGARPGAPVIVGFLRYDATGPECGRKWTDFSHSKTNDVNDNFGCATTANVAAMIADPGDLLAPRQSTPGDAARRTTVLSKYRAGDTTASVKDAQASGVISSALGSQ